MSGFASIVTSASAVTAYDDRSRTSNAFRSATSSVVGVPPPRNTLTTSSPSHEGAASSASRSNAATYRDAR